MESGSYTHLDVYKRQALDYLLEESQRRQILLFTCQKREMAYLQGKENVTVTEL